MCESFVPQCIVSAAWGERAGGDYQQPISRRRLNWTVCSASQSGEVVPDLVGDDACVPRPRARVRRETPDWLPLAPRCKNNASEGLVYLESSGAKNPFRRNSGYFDTD